MHKDAPTVLVAGRLPPTEDLPPLTRVGPYLVLQRLGIGGCCSVYRARKDGTDRDVALKVLHSDISSSKEMLERFLLEVDIINRIKHPAVVRVFDIGCMSDGRPFYAMELLEGGTLADLVRVRGRLAPKELVPLLVPVASALEAAHRAGVVHRDLKSNNIAVRFVDQKPEVRLLDFGIAKLVTPEGQSRGLTRAGRRLGTPATMAPEQFLAKGVDARTDVYALGVVAFHLLAGRYPFEGSEEEVERAHLGRPPPKLSEYASVPPALELAINRCMEKNPEYRYAGPVAFISAVQEAVGVSQSLEAMEFRSAVGILAEARAAGPLHPSQEEQALDEAADVIEWLEGRLTQAGLALAVQTATSVLGVRVLSAAPAESEGQCRAVLELVERLHADIPKRLGEGALTHVNLCVNVDYVVVSAKAQEIVGGELLRLGTWAPREPVKGVCATPRARDVLAPGNEHRTKVLTLV